MGQAEERHDPAKDSPDRFTVPGQVSGEGIQKDRRERDDYKPRGEDGEDRQRTPSSGSLCRADRADMIDGGKDEDEAQRANHDARNEWNRASGQLRRRPSDNGDVARHGVRMDVASVGPVPGLLLRPGHAPDNDLPNGIVEIRRGGGLPPPGPITTG